jgi:hypothetical protein
MKRNALGKIEDFLRHALKTKLGNDLRLHRITKEADAECCIYHHLRKTLPAKGPWRVLARKYVRETKHYVDLLVFKDGRPRLAVEIKWNRKAISAKDRKSLNRALNRLRVNKAYFICVGPDISRTSYQKLKKQPKEKHRLHEVCVGLDFTGKHRKAKIDQWKVKRDIFGRNMLPGKAGTKTV